MLLGNGVLLLLMTWMVRHQQEPSLSATDVRSRIMQRRTVDTSTLCAACATRLATSQKHAGRERHPHHQLQHHNSRNPRTRPAHRNQLPRTHGSARSVGRPGLEAMCAASTVVKENDWQHRHLPSRMQHRACTPRVRKRSCKQEMRHRSSERMGRTMPLRQKFGSWR